VFVVFSITVAGERARPPVRAGGGKTFGRRDRQDLTPRSRSGPSTAPTQGVPYTLAHRHGQPQSHTGESTPTHTQLYASCRGNRFQARAEISCAVHAPEPGQCRRWTASSRLISTLTAALAVQPTSRSTRR